MSNDTIIYMEFAWTFPLFITGYNHKVGPGGLVMFGPDTQLTTISKRYLAVFTDEDLATRFPHKADPAVRFCTYTLDHPSDAIGLLTLGSPPQIQGIIIDPNPETKIGITMTKDAACKSWAACRESM